MLVHCAKSSTSLVVSLAAILLVAPAPACSKSQETSAKPAAAASSAPRQTYSTAGKVRAIGERKDNITIAHEDIPGYMKAMTMMFEVEKPDMIKDINAGDQVTFTFTDRGEGQLFLESISKAK